MTSKVFNVPRYYLWFSISAVRRTGSKGESTLPLRCHHRRTGTHGCFQTEKKGLIGLTVTEFKAFKVEVFGIKAAVAVEFSGLVLAEDAFLLSSPYDRNV